MIIQSNITLQYSEVESSRTQFGVLGLGLKGQVLGLKGQTLASKPTSPRLEETTIF